MRFPERADRPARRPARAVELQRRLRADDLREVHAAENWEHVARAVDADIDDTHGRTERERRRDLIRGADHGLRRDHVAIDQVIARDGVGIECRAGRVADEHGSADVELRHQLALDRDHRDHAVRAARLDRRVVAGRGRLDPEELVALIPRRELELGGQQRQPGGDVDHPVVLQHEARRVVIDRRRIIGPADHRAHRRAAHTDFRNAEATCSRRAGRQHRDQQRAPHPSRVPCGPTSVHQEACGVANYSDRNTAWTALGAGSFASRNARAIAIGLP